MSRQILLLAGSLAAFAQGQESVLAETRMTNCKSALAAVGRRSPIEVAALCRSALPSDVCRDALALLGAQPWNPEKVSSTCEKFVPLLAPVGASKTRFLDAVSAAKLDGSPCSTVDPMTGNKWLHKNPWQSAMKGTSPFAAPTYILNGHSQAPSAPVSAARAPTMVDKSGAPGTAQAPAQPPAPTYSLNGVLQARMAPGVNFNPTVSGSRKAFEEAIATAVAIDSDTVHVPSISAALDDIVNVTFSVDCPSFTTMDTAKDNLAGTPKYVWGALLKSKVHNDMQFVKLSLQETGSGSSTGNKATGPTVRTPPLPDWIEPTAVLGSIKMMKKEISRITLDPNFEKALTEQIASAAKVDVSNTEITDVHAFPDQTDTGVASAGGLVEVFFMIHLPSGVDSHDIAMRLNTFNHQAFGFALWHTLTNYGSNQHFVMIQSISASVASDIKAKQSDVENAESNPLSVHAQVDALSRVEVHKGRSLAKEISLAATWALGMMVGATFCVMGAVALAKVWRRRQLLVLSREMPLATDDHGDCMPADQESAVVVAEIVEPAEIVE